MVPTAAVKPKKREGWGEGCITRGSLEKRANRTCIERVTAGSGSHGWVRRLRGPTIRWQQAVALVHVQRQETAVRAGDRRARRADSASLTSALLRPPGLDEAPPQGEGTCLTQTTRSDVTLNQRHPEESPTKHLWHPWPSQADTQNEPSQAWSPCRGRRSQRVAREPHGDPPRCLHPTRPPVLAPTPRPPSWD